jgi:hypothetical protein
MTPRLLAAETDLRQLAIGRLRKKRALQAHTLAYVTVNLFINVIWLLAAPHTFYWPVIPLFGWGIGLAFHIWDVYAPAVLTEERIEIEMSRLDPHPKAPRATNGDGRSGLGAGRFSEVNR